MLKNEYKGKDFLEIFNSSLKDPFANCKVNGASGIQKIYDKEMKGSICVFDGIPTVTRITIPKDTKQGLSLIQRCLVFQLEIRLGQEFSMEIGISDLSQNKRNLYFSTSHKELNVQPLSARIPLKCVTRGQWINLVIDIASFISELWKNQTFKLIDTVSVGANCKLRKIFSLKNVPSIEIGLLHETSLNQVDFPNGVNSKMQILTLNEILRANDSMDELIRVNSFESSLSESKSKLNNSYKIAFGTKVPSNNQLKLKNDIDLIGTSRLSSRRKSDSDNSNSNSAKNRNIHINENNQDNNNEQHLSLSSSGSSSNKQQKRANKLVNNQRTQSANNIEITNSKLKIDVNKNMSSSGGGVGGGGQMNNNLNNGNKNNGNLFEAKKLPHPPPPNTKTTVPSARKARLKPNNINLNDDKLKIKQDNDVNINVTTNNKNNLNESITDIIQALKLSENNEKKQNKHNSQTTPSSTTVTKAPNSTTTTATTTNVYSFSSKPKVVDLDTRKNQSNMKTYDFRKYVENTPKKSNDNDNLMRINSNSYNNKVVIDTYNESKTNYNNNNNKNNSSNNNFNNEMNEDHGDGDGDDVVNPPKGFSILSVLDNQPVVYDNHEEYKGYLDNLGSMDSFEKNMLIEMKAEMDSNYKTSTQHLNQMKMLKQKLSKQLLEHNNNNSNNGSGRNSAVQIQSPIIFDNSNHSNENTSDKLFNYEVVTNSYETDSTTMSMSKKMKLQRRLKAYQEEMNTMSNQRTSITTMKDYSVLKSLNFQANSPNIMKNTKNEDRIKYDDSQATDNVSDNSDDELQLVYDEGINCFYDPKTLKYYELKP